MALLTGPANNRRADQVVELALIEAGGDAFARSHALAAGALVDARLNSLERAERRWEEIDKILSSIGVPSIGTVVREAPVDDAADMLEHLTELFGLLHETVAGGSTPFDRTSGLVSTGAPDEQLAEIEAALSLSERIGDDPSAAVWQWHRSEALAAMGRDEDALASARAAVDAARRLPDDVRPPESLYALGVVAEEQGDRAAGTALFLAALAKTGGNMALSSRILARMAAGLLANGQPREAEDCLARALLETRVQRAELALGHDDPTADALLEEAVAMVHNSPDPIGPNLPDLAWLT